jgi:multiple sugar transport system substrate-binding protein
MYVFGKNSNLAPETQNDLAQFFGSTYHDGEYKVASRWVLEEGLGSIDTELMAREDVRASFSEWRDVDLYDQQLALAKPRNVHRQLWYPEWELNMIGKVQEFVLGSIEIGDVFSSMGETLDGLKQQYPSI